MKVHELIRMLQMCDPDVTVQFEHEGSGVFLSANVDKVFQVTTIPDDGEPRHRYTYVLLKE